MCATGVIVVAGMAGWVLGFGDVVVGREVPTFGEGAYLVVCSFRCIEVLFTD